LMIYSLPFISDTGVDTQGTIGVLGDIIDSLLYIHSVLPVIFVGHFVDPMTSLSARSFVLSGYVQTMGWNADDIELSATLPASFVLNPGQNYTIQVGDITEPGVQVVTWNITLLAYGEYDLTVSGNSTNAGSHSATATVLVTDLGVTGVGENEGEPTFGFILAQDSFDEMYNVGDGVVIPIRVEYYQGNYTGAVAYNASVQIGDYGLAAVNGSGYAYTAISEFDPGTYEIPIFFRYDKESGITYSIDNMSISLTFTSLEVFDVSTSATSAVAGEPITIQGSVRYSHDHSPVTSAVVHMNDILVVTTDETGMFSFQYTEQETGAMNYTLIALSDESGLIWMPTAWETIEITWTSFWSPLTIGIVVGGLGAVVIVVVLGVFRYRRGSGKSEMLRVNNVKL